MTKDDKFFHMIEEGEVIPLNCEFKSKTQGWCESWPPDGGYVFKKTHIPKRVLHPRYALLYHVLNPNKPKRWK